MKGQRRGAKLDRRDRRRAAEQGPARAHLPQPASGGGRMTDPPLIVYLLVGAIAGLLAALAADAWGWAWYATAPVCWLALWLGAFGSAFLLDWWERRV